MHSAPTPPPIHSAVNSRNTQSELKGATFKKNHLFQTWSKSHESLPSSQVLRYLEPKVILEPACLEQLTIEWLITSPRAKKEAEDRMEPDVQPESDGAPSWRASMSPSSSLPFVLHVQGDGTTVVMQSIDTGRCSRAQSLFRACSRAPLQVAQGGRTTSSM